MKPETISARETDQEFPPASFAKSVSHLSKRSPGGIFLRPPAFQFYADDFLGGTIGMNNEERGLYITLLCIQWNRGGVTEDDFERNGKGMAIASLSHVKGKFELCDKDGLFRNKRMEIVRREQTEHRKNRVNAGRIGAKARWQTHSDRNATAMAKHSSPTPTPISNINGAQVVVLGKELERVIARLSTIKGTYGDHQTWASEDLTEYKNLVERRRYLRTTLGIKA